MVTGFEVEMRKLPNGYFEPAPAGVAYLSTLSKGAEANVQQITLNVDSDRSVNSGHFWLVLPTGSGAYAPGRFANSTAGSDSANRDSYGSAHDVGDPARRSVTVQLRYDATAEEVRGALQDLCGSRAASVHVDRLSGDPGLGRASDKPVAATGALSWRVEFRPTAGQDAAHFMNFGDLPALEPVSNGTGLVSQVLVHAGSGFGFQARGSGLNVTNGYAPFAATVEPAALSPEHTTAVDQYFVAGENGLSTGIFEHETAFSNRVTGGGTAGRRSGRRRCRAVRRASSGSPSRCGGVALRQDVAKRCGGDRS